MSQEIIAISSFKGGTAKTSTALHLGAALSKFHKKRVLLIDFDAQANLSAGLGFDPDEQDSLAPVLQGTKSLHDVIVPLKDIKLDLIAADSWLERIEVTSGLATNRYSHERLRDLLQLCVHLVRPSRTERGAHTARAASSAQPHRSPRRLRHADDRVGHLRPRPDARHGYPHRGVLVRHARKRVRDALRAPPPRVA